MVDASLPVNPAPAAHRAAAAGLTVSPASNLERACREGLSIEKHNTGTRSTENYGRVLVNFIRRSDVHPVLGWKVVKSRQCLPVFHQRLYRFRILRFVVDDEAVKRTMRVFPASRHPDVLKCGFGLGLLTLGQLVQHVGRLVNPAALPSGMAKYLRQRFPETQGAIADRQLRINLQTARLQVQQHFLP
jgi:hypothetical protein